MRYFLGGTSVLIVVGVALELVDKLNAQLVMKAYDGGMRPPRALARQAPAGQGQGEDQRWFVRSSSFLGAAGRREGHAGRAC